MAITSTGLASGVDIQSIVSQLVALERAPLPEQHAHAVAQVLGRGDDGRRASRLGRGGGGADLR